MAEQLKNIYNKVYLENLSKSFAKNVPNFDSQSLIDLSDEDPWEDWSLMERLHGITDRIEKLLPGSYAKQLATMEACAPNFGGFEAMFFPDFAERFGLNDPELSIPYLKFVTQFSSSEFAIRPFILQDSKTVMAMLNEWSKDSNEHVRRLSSEGCRPRLPWSINLPDFIDDPSPIFPILENLKSDDAKYVQKSVANNLNDISKDHPLRIVDIAKKWKGNDPNTNWIVKHACRTLLKAGTPEILPVFGYHEPKDVKVIQFSLENPTPKIGDITRFNASIRNEGQSDFKTRLEYIVSYPRNSKQYEKVFFIKETVIPGNTDIEISGKIDLEEKSTRKIYPGPLTISLQINGVREIQHEMQLIH